MKRQVLCSCVAACMFAAALFPVNAIALEEMDRASAGARSDVGSEAVTPYGNHSDKSFEFKMPKRGSTSGTGYRKKDDDSSVYVNISECRGRPRMFVDGAVNTSGGQKRNCTATVYRASVKGPHRMRNFVNEWGFSYARLTSWNDESVQAYVKGVWSPDSYKSAGYPELPSN